MSHQALRKSRGSDDHCTEICVVTCSRCCMIKNIRNDKTHIKKRKKLKKKKKKGKKWKNRKKRNRMKMESKKIKKKKILKMEENGNKREKGVSPQFSLRMRVT